MDKTASKGKVLSRFLVRTAVLFVFPAAVLIFGPGNDLRAAGGDGRHILIERNDVRARRSGYDVGPKNLRPQPVLFSVPEGVLVEAAGEGGFAANRENANLFGLLQGKVYRFKFTHLPYAEGRELYPTLELLSTLSPPAGYEAVFPIPVELTEEDIRLALDGNLVTRVVYLEPPHNAIPVDSTVKQGAIATEAPASIDPVALAESHGRVMAILRLGSRIPDPETDLSDFCFGYPAVTFPEKTDRPLGFPLYFPLPDPADGQADSDRTEE